MSGTGGIPTAALEDIAYLARSENRVSVLAAVDERPRDQRELAAETDVSRSTLSRVLRELEERDWVRQSDDGYATTTAGSLLTARFDELLETTGTIRRLGKRLELLPVEEMSVPVRHFHDATVVTPDEHDPTRPFDYGVAMLEATDRVRALSSLVPAPYLRALHERVTAGDVTAQLVVEADYVEALNGDRLGLLEDVAGDVDLRRSGGSVPYDLFVLDEAVHLWLCTDGGEAVGLVETRDPAVRRWAESTVDSYADRATRIDPGAMA